MPRWAGLGQAQILCDHGAGNVVVLLAVFLEGGNGQILAPRALMGMEGKGRGGEHWRAKEETMGKGGQIAGRARQPAASGRTLKSSR